ncbi:MAG: Uncharacterised protein [SAR116 cluster bacterium MED-G04]|jgi:hypothetical protein|nr:MAG: Uncharacterised protein [SAR116 cluster bacterium MED-G04]|tara:strand:+ start:189 stop:473 length:285 start_codon:yes stop_codon:yes gene_type:complete
MWIRFVEIKSPSKMQFEMTASYFKTEWSPKVLALGAVSTEFVRLSENSGMYVICYPDEATAKDVFMKIKSDVEEHSAQNKTTIREGERIFKLEA